MRSSDFVTLIGLRLPNKLSLYEVGDESHSTLALSPESLANVRDNDRLTQILRAKGGLAVRLTRLENGGARVAVAFSPKPSYVPPTELILLCGDRTLERKGLRPEPPTTIDLAPGDHVLLPRDLEAQAELNKFCDGLKCLPPDYEELMFNVIRRPGDWRIGRPESMDRGGTQKKASASKWFNQRAAMWLILAEFVALVGLLVLYILMPAPPSPDPQKEFAMHAARDADAARQDAKEAEQAVLSGDLSKQKILQAKQAAEAAARLAQNTASTALTVANHAKAACNRSQKQGC